MTPGRGAICAVLVAATLGATSCSAKPLALGDLKGQWVGSSATIEIDDGWFSSTIAYQDRSAFVPRKFKAQIDSTKGAERNSEAIDMSVSLAGISVICHLRAHRERSVLEITGCLHELNGYWSRPPQA